MSSLTYGKKTAFCKRNLRGNAFSSLIPSADVSPCCNDLERTRGNWGITITQARNEIADDLEDSPSLRSYPAAVLDRVYQRARREARDQSQLTLSTFPEQCPWPIENILEDGWL
jgi:hypothetical protein